MELLEVAVLLHRQCVLVPAMRRRWRVYGISFPILLRVDGVFLSGAVGGIVESSGELAGSGRRLGPAIAEVQPVVERATVREGFFTFSTASVTDLTARANGEIAGTAAAATTISSLQAVLAHP